MSIVVIVNEKFRERVPAWTSIKSRPEIFPGLAWGVKKIGNGRCDEHSLSSFTLHYCSFFPIIFLPFHAPFPPFSYPAYSLALLPLPFFPLPIKSSIFALFRLGFFRRVREALLEASAFSFREQTALVIFLIHCFNSVEVDMVRLEIQKLVSLGIWANILPERREAELK